MATKLNIDDVEQLAQAWDKEIETDERRRAVVEDARIDGDLKKMGL